MQSDLHEENTNYPEIPDKFAKYAEEIKATVKDTVTFKLKPDTDSKPWQSRVGKSPYLPLGVDYPCNSKGVPLTFLMQINFSEMPPLHGYPIEGIVSFYVDGTDDLLGLDYNNPTKQDGFRVLYFQSIEQDEAKLQLAIEGDENKENYGPFDKNCNMLMEFFPEKQYITPLDYRLEKCVSFGEDDDIVEEYMEVFETEGHRVGGYPYFRQYDPRPDSNFQDYELLVQLNSEYDDGIMWGDSGVGSFFIHPNDLKECNFSNVLYNWDCC